MLYDGVFDYPAPSLIFGGALNDLRPQGVSRNPSDYVYKKPIQQFDRTKALLPNGYDVTFEYNKGAGIMRVAQVKAMAKVTLDSMNSTTGWTAGGTASGLVLDSTVYYESPGSLRFKLTGAGAGTLTKTLSNALSLSTYENVGVGFLAIRTPSVDTLTSISFDIGSDSANYSRVTETEGFLGAWYVDNFLLVAFDLAGSVNTGTPNFSAIKYLRLTVNHTDTIVNMRFGGLFMSLPSPHELLFQTAAIFINSVTGEMSNTIATDNDQVILNDAAYTIFEYECAKTIIMATGGSLSSGMGQQYQDYLHNKDIGLYPLYQADNPSQEIRTVGNYYDDNDN